MNLRALMGRLVAGTAVRVLSWFDAGIRWSTERSYVPGFVQDVRLDLNSATREEILRKARYYAGNCGLVQRMGDVFVQYVAGPSGIRITPASSDPEWNKAARVAWNEWSEFADINSRQTLAELQSICADRLFHDGEVFILKTRGETGRPRIQLIESHRVQTPWDRVSDATVSDGVEVNASGRPVAYWVRDSWDGQKFRRIEAGRIIHVFAPTRPGQLRGLPFYASVLNLLGDYLDLQHLEMLAAKVAAAVANVVKRVGGGPPVDLANLKKQLIQGTATKADGSEYTKTRREAVQSVIGGQTVILEPGEELTQFRSDRPSVVTQAYWDFLVSQICAGAGINRSLVFPVSLQGTVARGDLDVAAAFFRAHSEILKRCFFEVYVYVIGDAIAYTDLGRIRFPADWRKANARPPRTPNVDVGRNSRALIEEYEAGFRTLESVCAEAGEDWRETVDQKGEEAAYILEVAKARGVDPSMISTRLMDRPERIQSEQTNGGQPKPADAFSA